MNQDDDDPTPIKFESYDLEGLDSFVEGAVVPDQAIEDVQAII